jgi:hypothetical protein
MTERSWVQTPTEETIFQATFIWIKRRVDFEEGWLIKSSFITKDEIKLVS